MQAPSHKALAAAATLTAVLAACDPASAANRHKSRVTPSAPAITRDYDGTPIIMRGFDRRPRGQEAPAEKRGTRGLPPRIPRGSSSYIPPPVPSPDVNPPAPLTHPPQVHRPPPIRSFGDRVTDCIHSYPLNRGIGNNPIDMQSYIRQCAQ